jgi:hypothetical protein
LNTWLIEEVEWSTRYCNDQPRLTECPSAPGGINRENNMVDPERWDRWMILLDYVKSVGQPMTIGDYSLAMMYDNAPTVANPDQLDSDHNGIGDVIDMAELDAQDVVLECGEGMLIAVLTYMGEGIQSQLLSFELDLDGDGTTEIYTATTNADGVASVPVSTGQPLGTIIPYLVEWDAVVTQLQDDAIATVADTTPPEITEISVTPDSLWSPNHKMVPVTITVIAEDNCDPNPVCIISEINSNEPQEGPGIFDTDWQITGELTAELRAERLGTGTDRVYTLQVICTDNSGNSVVAEVTVTVPHDRGSIPMKRE